MKSIASSKLPKLRRTLISPSQMTQNRLCVKAGPSIGMSVLFISLSPRAFLPLETAAVASWAPTRFAAEEPYATGARFATGGGSKIRLMRRLPQRGHIIRSRKPASGIFRPRVQTSVSRFSSA